MSTRAPPLPRILSSRCRPLQRRWYAAVCAFSLTIQPGAGPPTGLASLSPRIRRVLWNPPFTKRSGGLQGWALA